MQRILVLFLLVYAPILLFGAQKHFASAQCRPLFYYPFSRKSLPTERVKTASKESQQFWNHYNENFKKSVRKYIETYLEYYLTEKSNGNPHIAFLESLGFRFLPTVEIPDLLSMMDEVEMQIRQNILLGKIKENDVLWPRMRIFARDSIGQKLIGFEVDAGGELPHGRRWKEVSIEINNRTLLSDIEFAKNLADSRFPTGGLRSANQRNSVNEILHDLAHIGAMIKHPEYMRSIKIGYRRLLKQTRGLPDSFKIGSNLWFKTFFALESFFIVKPEMRSEIPAFFGLESFLQNNPNPSVKQIEEFYNSLPQEQYSIISQRIQSDSFRYFEILGAAHRDLLSYNSFNALQFPLNYFTMFVPRSRAALFAKLVLTTKDLSIEKWMDLLFHHGPLQSKEAIELSSDESFIRSTEEVVRFLGPIFRN